MKLLKLWWITAALWVAGWHADRHNRIVSSCRKSLLRMGVVIDG